MHSFCLREVSLSHCISLAVNLFLSCKQISIQWLSSDENYYRTPSANDEKCSMSALPPPPTPVLGVTLTDLEYSEETMEIQFHVQWNLPDSPNGEINQYEACLGGRNIPNGEEDPANVQDSDTYCRKIDTVRFTINTRYCVF